ncbi:MAG TPA: ATP-binding protein, partial [Gemmatimonadaceae bacterium]|nr:ATP-binding protein [Gemmatimonadaceae bacterium]
VDTEISERKSLEAQFQQSQKMEAVGQLAGGVAHDFNNLMTVVLGYSAFVTETLGVSDPRRADLDEVVRAAQRATALTRQLLAFSRKQVLQPTNVDLNALVLGMQDMLARLIGEDILIEHTLAADLWAVRADVGQLEQVLMNLTVNARDAMPTGGRLSFRTSNVEMEEPDAHSFGIGAGCYVLLAVADNGTGMTESVRKRLFEPFFTTKLPGKGTGLGLATVYGIVKQTGGTVSVTSTPGAGATFEVYLPCALGNPQALLPAAPDRGGTIRGTETILIVEDEDGVRLLTRRILEQSGYRVFDANDADHAEAVFAKHARVIDLLLTDVVMPGISGPKLFARLQEQQPGLKVLYLSGYTQGAIVEQGPLGPGIELLQKPFTAAALNERVREVIEGPTPQPAGRE